MRPEDLLRSDAALNEALGALGSPAGSAPVAGAGVVLAKLFGVAPAAGLGVKTLLLLAGGTLAGLGGGYALRGVVEAQAQHPPVEEALVKAPQSRPVLAPAVAESPRRAWHSTPSPERPTPPSSSPPVLLASGAHVSDVSLAMGSARASIPPPRDLPLVEFERQTLPETKLSTTVHTRRPRPGSTRPGRLALRVLAGGQGGPQAWAGQSALGGAALQVGLQATGSARSSLRPVLASSLEAGVLGGADKARLGFVLEAGPGLSIDRRRFSLALGWDLGARLLPALPDRSGPEDAGAGWFHLVTGPRLSSRVGPADGLALVLQVQVRGAWLSLDGPVAFHPWVGVSAGLQLPVHVFRPRALYE